MGDPNKVQARGPGLEPVGNVAAKPTYFDIYTAGKGQGSLKGSSDMTCNKIAINLLLERNSLL